MSRASPCARVPRIARISGPPYLGRGPGLAAAAAAWLFAAYAAAHAPPPAALVQAAVATPWQRLGTALPAVGPASGNMRQVRWREINF